MDVWARGFQQMAFTYLLLNKPFQVLCQFTPGATGPNERRTLSEFVSTPNVYPVGRLDYDSEGLVLLTDDGKLQHRLSDPRFEHPRTYWVQVEGEITRRTLEQLRNGLQIQNYRTKSCQAQVIDAPELWPRNPPIRYRANIPTSWLEITLTEGRNRQVRRMTAAVGCPTLRLVRVRLAEISIVGLAPGSVRSLTLRELEVLRQQ